MNNSIGLVAIAVMGGAAVALQGQFMGMMDRKIGTSGALFVNYASGVLVAAIILLLLHGGSLKNFVQVPWYALSAGILGLVIAGSIGFTVHRRCSLNLFAQQLALLRKGGGNKHKFQFLLKNIQDHWVISRQTISYA